MTLRSILMDTCSLIVISWRPKVCAWEPTFFRQKDRLLTWNALKQGTVSGTFILKMSGRMKRSLPYLQVLAEAKPKLRGMIINHAPSEVINAICESCLNLLKGVIPLTPRQKRRLARYRTHLRALANKKVSQKKKRRYLSQKGGAFRFFLPPTLRQAA